ncbi:MAG: glutaminyl-peptide cyclotransferase [Gammaproteobacteria bacterium]|nr:glutaminyl-peptide cyclotransferase [Gammaproteobacteria bacterium]
MRMFAGMAGVVLCGYVFSGAAAAADSRCDFAIGKGAKGLRSIPELTYEIDARYPHDPAAFTEGLVYFRGAIYESTGLLGSSTVRRLDIESGRVEHAVRLPDSLFGEGLIVWDGELIQLTWKVGVALVYGPDLSRKGSFAYAGEGWGGARMGDRLVVSDGSSRLRFIARDGQGGSALRVTAGGVDVDGLNELEVVGERLYANVYPTDCIVRIDPATGIVNGRLDISGLLPWSERPDGSAVANGIAYDPATGALFVTGKRWPYLFRIRVNDTERFKED